MQSAKKSTHDLVLKRTHFRNYIGWNVTLWCMWESKMNNENTHQHLQNDTGNTIALFEMCFYVLELVSLFINYNGLHRLNSYATLTGSCVHAESSFGMVCRCFDARVWCECIRKNSFKLVEWRIQHSAEFRISSEKNCTSSNVRLFGY